MDSNGLMQFAGAVASGAVRVVDLTFTLSPEFPVIVLPPEFGQAAPVRIQQISRYDASGPAWYWNNLTFGEHTGCLLYTSPSPRDGLLSRMPSSA